MNKPTNFRYNSLVEMESLPAIKNNSRNDLVVFKSIDISKELVQLGNNNREYISSSWRSHLNRVSKYKKVMKVLKHYSNFNHF